MITLFLLVFIVWPMAGFIWMVLDAIDHTSTGWSKNKTLASAITFMVRQYIRAANWLSRR